MTLEVIARSPNIWEIFPFLASQLVLHVLMWGGDQQRLQPVYDVVAIAVPDGGCNSQLLGSDSNIQTYPNRLWCIWVLFTLLAFALKGQALERIHPQPLAFSV